jgi:hypothetical protein
MTRAERSHAVRGLAQGLARAARSTQEALSLTRAECSTQEAPS